MLPLMEMFPYMVSRLIAFGRLVPDIPDCGRRPDDVALSPPGEISLLPSA